MDQIIHGRLINRITGEIGDPADVLPDSHPPGRGKRVNSTRFSTPYVTVFRPAIPVITSLRSDDRRVLFAVIDQTVPGTINTHLDSTAAADFAGLTPKSLNNSLGRLVTSGLIARPAPGIYALNPLYLWCHGAQSRETLVSGAAR